MIRSLKFVSPLVMRQPPKQEWPAWEKEETKSTAAAESAGSLRDVYSSGGSMQRMLDKQLKNERDYWSSKCLEEASMEFKFESVYGARKLTAVFIINLKIPPGEVEFVKTF